MAILDIECETIAGHTCKVIVCAGGAPAPDALLERIATGAAAAPPLRARLGEDEDGRPAWVETEDFDAAAHVTLGDWSEPLGEAELAGLVAERFERRLDRNRPLWEVDVVPLRGDGVALVWRIHHALADGTTAMRLAHDLFWDESDAAATTHPHHHDPGAAEHRARHTLAFIEHELGESPHRSPFDGRVGAERRVAFASVPLGPLHDAVRELGGATLNDAVLAVATGSLRHWLQAHHGSLHGLRARVPVSLHTGTGDAGNRDSFFTVALPLAEPDPVERLRLVQAATSARKTAREAEELDTLLRELHTHSPALERLCKRIQASPRRFALSVSNVPGPAGDVTVLGAPVTGFHSVVEIGNRHALRVAVVSVAGRLNFGFCADPHIVEDLDAMARGVEAEAHALIEATK